MGTAIKNFRTEIITNRKEVDTAITDLRPFLMKTPDRIIIIQAYDKAGTKRVITFSYDKHEWFDYGQNYGIMMEKFRVHLHEILSLDKTIAWYKADGFRLMNGEYENCMNFLPIYI